MKTLTIKGSKKSKTLECYEGLNALIEEENERYSASVQAIASTIIKFFGVEMLAAFVAHHILLAQLCSEDCLFPFDVLCWAEEYPYDEWLGEEDSPFEYVLKNCHPVTATNLALICMKMLGADANEKG